LRDAIGPPETDPVLPETRFAKTADGVNVAYQILGDGPVDIVFCRPVHSNLEHEWEEPVFTRIFRRLASIGRLIRFDRRGMGLSDRIRGERLPTIEERMDDMRAVLDAVNSDRALLIGLVHATPLCMVFAASHPERTIGLVTFEAWARGSFAPDYPWAMTEEELDRWVEEINGGWGTVEYAAAQVRRLGPSRVGDPRYIQWLAEDIRRTSTPAEAAVQARMDFETDVRDVLPSINVPTLVLCRADAQAEESRAIAELIPDSTFVALPGPDHILIAGDIDSFLVEIERFVENIKEAEADDDRVLATLLFTDIVGSTSEAARIGDRSWADLLGRHYQRLARQVTRFRGREIDQTGDGIFATFDGPARAIRCALACVRSVRDLGVEIRAGVHIGEVQREGDGLRGLAVHVGARVGALAGPGEVLVSSTVKDLVAGSGLAFNDRGEHELKGVPGAWRLYSVAGD
jgi:class 3 adenylate cyclase